MSEEVVNMYSKHTILNMYGKYMHLKVYIDTSDESLLEKYRTTIEAHNKKWHNHPSHIDAGFDILTPTIEHILYANKVNKVDYQIICSAKIIEPSLSYNSGFYMYPRSSISKSHLRLANNTGIIDAGYRGHLIGMFDVVYSSEPVKLEAFDRHLQICAPGLIPIYVELVQSREELGDQTLRGENGIGSTGK